MTQEDELPPEYLPSQGDLPRRYLYVPVDPRQRCRWVTPPPDAGRAGGFALKRIKNDGLPGGWDYDLADPNEDGGDGRWFYEAVGGPGADGMGSLEIGERMTLCEGEDRAAINIRASQLKWVVSNKYPVYGPALLEVRGEFEPEFKEWLEELDDTPQEADYLTPKPKLVP